MVACDADGTACGRGRGTCQSGICLCNPGYANQGDFLRDSGCSVNVQANHALWAVEAVLWILVVLGAAYALAKLERRTKEAFINEALVLSCTIFGAICLALVGILSATSNYPGERSVGLDHVTTAFFVVGNSLIWIFLTLNPLSRSQTGVGSLALARVKQWRIRYVRFVPVLVVLCLVCSLMPLITLYDPGTSGNPAAIAFFTLTAILTLINAAVSGITIWLMKEDFNKALSSSTQEIPASQRAAIVKIAASTKRLIFIPLFGLLVLTPALIIFASPLLIYDTWVTLPISIMVAAFWMMRYVSRSIKASSLVRERENEKTSHMLKATAEIETRNSSGGNEGKLATDSNSSSVSSNPSKQKNVKKVRKTFRLKGFKSKPMQFMTHVTEGNSEGTVRFTEVDGVDTMQTSSSRYSRPITLSNRIDAPPPSPRAGHLSVSSVQSTLWEVDINGTTEPPETKERTGM